MLDDISINRVDRFGENLRDELQDIAQDGRWGAKFDLSRAPTSDYYRARLIIGDKPQKKNFVQLNGHTYGLASYADYDDGDWKFWKLLARYSSHPGSPLWEKKKPYEHDRIIKDKKIQEWALGGSDVWAISYERLSDALSNNGAEDIKEEIMQDLKVAWAYANGRKYSTDIDQLSNRIEITLSIDRKVWSGFQEAYARLYMPRKKHPKRPSYAELRNQAVDSALVDYVKKWNRD